MARAIVGPAGGLVGPGGGELGPDTPPPIDLASSVTFGFSTEATVFDGTFAVVATTFNFEAAGLPARAMVGPAGGMVGPAGGRLGPSDYNILVLPAIEIVAASSFGFSTAATISTGYEIVVGVGSKFRFSSAVVITNYVHITAVVASTFGFSTHATVATYKISSVASAFGFSTAASIDVSFVQPPFVPRDERIWRMFYQRVGAWYSLRNPP